MKAIEILGLMALVTLIYNVSLFFIKYKRKAYMNKEQVTIEASIETYDETPKLKARIEFLEAEIEKFATICDEMTDANKKYLDYFEAYVRLTQDEPPKPVKRSVTTLQEKECIRIGEGDWEKLAPLFEEAGIVWWKGQKASEIIPEIGYCVSVNYYGKNELTQDSEHFNVENGFTVLPASDFIEEAKGIIEEMPTAKEILGKHFDVMFEKQEPAIDWSKPVAFPKGYKIPKGTNIICIGDSFGIIAVGTNGITTETDDVPYCEFKVFGGERAMDSHELAPLNPTDHPNHPDYVER